MGDVPVIMIVEDDAEMNALLCELLSTHEMNSLQAYSGKEAIEIFSRERIDGILLDLMMPEMDGLEACREIRQMSDNPHLPIIMITAIAGRGVLEEGYEAGADSFFIKPFMPGDIINKLKTLLEKSGKAG